MPLVATTGGSLPEVVGDAGVIVPHSDPAALAQAIDALLKDPARREKLSDRGRQRILDNFTWARCAAEVVEMYKSTIAKNAGLTPVNTGLPTGDSGLPAGDTDLTQVDTKSDIHADHTA